MNRTNELGKKLYTGEFTCNSIWIFGLLTLRFSILWDKID